MPQPWSARNTQGGPEILTTAQMYAADKAAMTAGVSGPTLMDHAGWAVTRHAVDMLRRIRAEDARRRLTGPVVILCGPGNNGGDGFVVARLLARRGIAVRVYLLGASEALTGDAAVMAQRWSGPVHKISALAEGDAARLLRHVPLVVDALFGAGLSRALDPGVLSLFAQISQALCPVLAIDMPSGVQGNTGDVLGGALQAQKTVTFFRLKPGHLIEPGAALCGQVHVEQIGIPDRVLGPIAPTRFLPDPQRYPIPKWDAQSHKYKRGHGVVLAGPRMIGAACLAGQAARRVGAGLLSIAGSALSLGPALASAPGLMLWDRQRDGDLPVLLADPRRNAVLVGPGRGRGEAAEGDVCQEVRLATEASAALVLDADALMAFADDPDALFALLRARGGRLGPSGLAVLTPHDGEFVALFGPDGEHDRLEATRAAAKQAQAVVLRKGPVSIIAEPTHGHAVINREDNPDLATAGSGDVLAGAVLGLLTQGADPMTAAVAANRIHRHAARLAGPLAGGGMIAEDLLERLGQASAAERSHL